MSECLNNAIRAVGDAIVKNKEWLTELDSAIGDADHGINMSRGFTAVGEKLKALGNDKDPATVLKAVGMTLISTVGGAAGPLYGTAFLRASAAVAGKNVLDRDAMAAVLAAAISGIKERGKAVQGEKTILDALEPAYAAFAAGAAGDSTLAECLALARDAAEQGVEYTKTIIATKGRASYLGQRSLGHQDPGATSTYIILAALSDFCRQTEAM